MIKKLVISSFVLAIQLATGLAANAQNIYPSKPIRAIIPFNPGGGGDIMGRTVLQKISEELKQVIYIENLAGAGGNIGAAAASRAPADGYTLLYGTNGTHAINASLYKTTGFDHINDFKPVTRISEIAAIVSVRPDLPVKSIKELVEYSKTSKEPLNYASAGNGTTSHLAGELFKQVTGVNWTHVPYKGGASAVTDLMASRVDVLMDVAPSLAPHVKSGRIKALAVTSAERSKAFESLPTVAESGYPNYVVTAWDGIFVPAKTDDAIVQKLVSAATQALNNPELTSKLADRVAKPSPLESEKFKSFILTETQRWNEVVTRSGAKVD